jgi:amino acid adenylation domain-containing protein
MFNTPNLVTKPAFVPNITIQNLPKVNAPFTNFWQSDYYSTPQKFIFLKEAMCRLSFSDQILFEQFGQGPIVPLPHTRIHHAFEAYAQSQPQAVAVAHLGESISYQELDWQANRIAGILTQHGVTSGDNVALFLQRSIPMIAGILGALKAGASYVPQYVGVAPEAHLRHVIKTADTKVLLTLSHLKHLVPVPAGHICLALDEIMQEPLTADYRQPFQPKTPISPENTCYIIFTSGTTGTPNGVQVTHRNTCNLLLTAPGDLGIKPGMKVAQILSIAFDMAAWEILATLANGGTLVIRGKDFMETVKQVDVVISTPSILATFDADQCHNIKIVAVAGEPCPKPLADKWGEFCAFNNSCGPTEVTIINTLQRYYPWTDQLTIGKPTPNNTVYILDQDLNPCPIGEVGEMWAGGDCVSAGYLKNDQLNSDRYADDPFLGGGRKMFRTRDLGRWTATGELEHFGRTDDQVKVRGFRVELDSVSRALESVPTCEQAVTLKFDNSNLVAFVSPETVDLEKARQAVAKDLPYYYVPSFIIPLDALPKTPRGKLDKRKLMQIAIAHNETMLVRE